MLVSSFRCSVDGGKHSTTTDPTEGCEGSPVSMRELALASFTCLGTIQHEETWSLPFLFLTYSHGRSLEAFRPAAEDSFVDCCRGPNWNFVHEASLRKNGMSRARTSRILSCDFSAISGPSPRREILLAPLFCAVGSRSITLRCCSC